MKSEHKKLRLCTPKKSVQKMTYPPFPSMHRYRKKQTTSSSATGGLSLLDVPCNGQLSTSEQVILHHNVTAAPVDQPDNGGGDPVDQEDAEVDRGNLNSAQNLEDTYAFADAKRKLRLMLSEADLSLLASLPPMTATPPPAAIQGIDK